MLLRNSVDFMAFRCPCRISDLISSCQLSTAFSVGLRCYTESMRIPLGFNMNYDLLSSKLYAIN